MANRVARIRDAYRTVREIANDLDPSDEYYFQACVEQYFRLKGLALQVSQGDCTGRYWRGCNEGALAHNAHLECRGMGEIEAMEEYIRVALSLRGDTAFGDYCYDALLGERVLEDLGLDESD